MKRGAQRCERHAIDLLEEAVHLLRLAPLAVLARYYLGGFPFVLGFLFFWTDMSQSAFARERISASALVLGLLFFWMKIWQTIFTRQLLSRISGQSSERWTWSSLGAVAIGQIILQPSGLFALPIAVIITLPFGWVYAFYQNVTVLGGRERDLKTLGREAVRQAQLWPAQNHLLLAFLSVGALFAFLNLGLACFLIPQLLKMLFGIETVFTVHPLGMLNSTFFVALAGLTYLCLDPLVKAVYALRCFYGRAIESGEDLKSELRSLPNWQESKQPVEPVNLRPTHATQSNPRIASMSSSIVLSALLFVPSAMAAPAQERPLSAEPTAVPASTAVPAVELDRAIDHVLSRPEFSWRMPRTKVEPGDKPGWFMGFVRSAFDMVAEGIQGIARFCRKVFEWLRDKFFNKLRPPHPADGSMGWMTSLQFLLYGLLAVVVAVLAIMALRTWRRRRSRIEEMLAISIPAAPDISDENVLADELPEEAWLKLGRELMDGGELRLALRAFYLAGLAHLGQRELIRIARFKSNRDYELELRRRAHTRPDLVAAFAETGRLFDRVWYGLHEVTSGDLNSFQITVERIAAC